MPSLMARRDGARGKFTTCQINTSLVPVKVAVLFFMGAESVYSHFYILQLRRIGLTSFESGILGSILALMTLVASPLFGAYADKYNRHKSTTIVTLVVSAAVILSILLLPVQNTRATPCVKNGSMEAPVNNSQSVLSVVSYGDRQKGSPVYALCEGNITLWHSCHDISDNTRAKTPEALALLTDCLGEKRLVNCNNISSSSTDMTLNQCAILYNGTVSVNSVCEQNLTCAQQESRDVDFKWTFWAVLAIFTIGGFLHAPTYGLVYAMIYAMLKDDWHEWGKQRLWGSVSMVITVIGATILLNAYSQNDLDVPYEICFYIFGIETIFAGIAIFKSNLPEGIRSSSVCKGSLQLLSSFPSVSLFINVTLFGIYMGSTMGFLLLHMTDQNNSETAAENMPIIFGLYIALDSLLEIPLFYISGKLIQRLGHIFCMGVSAAAYGTRLLAYSFIRNPWYILITTPLNAISFALIEFTSTSYVNLISPPGLVGVSQGIVSALFLGLGYGCGTLLTGLLFDLIGSVWTYRLYAASAFGLLLPFIVVQAIVGRRAARHERANRVKDDYAMVQVSEDTV